MDPNGLGKIPKWMMTRGTPYLSSMAPMAPVAPRGSRGPGANWGPRQRGGRCPWPLGREGFGA